MSTERKNPLGSSAVVKALKEQKQIREDALIASTKSIYQDIEPSNDNSKGKIICDYFYRKGLLSKKLWKADESYGAELMISEPDVMKGYHAWARHYVREMEKESLLGKAYFAWAKLWVPHWAKYLAGEKTIRGKILHSIGKPICNMIGKFNRRIKWQQA